ncbi:unnamed protein product [Darwinula stevensoni]|uniref:U5 small nuclear ribonucleoprotein 200 kDa helicase n=1 Tax=Darwinula stevensoni TaxID=69355 RepID=A0A7R9A6K1_9CRUS|nr:unnamed protein product [Darwinula stevensoni]CAG0888066.1 unnamed protein product [Darwinula stevensoni]
MWVPRVITAIRAQSSISNPLTYPSKFQHDPVTLLLKRRDLTEKGERVRAWERLNHEIGKRRDKEKLALHLVKELRSFTHDLCGREAPEATVEDACALLFYLFNEKRVVEQRDIGRLRLSFGDVSSSSANKAFKKVKELCASLPETLLEEVKGKSHADVDETTKLKAPFGADLKIDASVSGPPFPPGREDALIDFYSLDTHDHAPGVSLQLLPDVGQAVKQWDRVWLENSLKASVVMAGITPSELVSSVVTLLSSKKCNEELQNELFDLLGFERFELIEEILMHRKEILDSSKQVGSTLNVPVQARSEKRPLYGCQVIVQSEEEALARKQMRRDEKKLIRQTGKILSDDPGEGGDEFDPALLRAIRESQLEEAKRAPIFRRRVADGSRESIPYPHVYDSLAVAKSQAALVGGRKMVLPATMQRVNTERYEEINIPHSGPALLPSDIGQDLISISSLDDIGQVAFKGTESLNLIQSIVYPTAYYTNENLLVCAPTGAGKTNVAMLAVVHQIRQHLDPDGTIKKDSFKIIYVAPMKALAAEVVEKFSQRLAPLGLQVKELTGDMQMSKAEILSTQMIVTTPEKWDVVTRKPGDASLSQLVKLLIFDEVHLLHGDRGPVVESSQRMIRIVGLSATLPNYVDVAMFLGVNPRVGLFVFDSRFRPVPLNQTFIGVRGRGNSLQQVEDMDHACYEKVVSFLEKGKQVMVFVHARNATTRTALVIKELALKRGQAHLFAPPDNSALGLAQKNIARSKNKLLNDLFPHGLATHHAGMLRSDRNLVEKYFREGYIQVLVCTATLAWGVNLPAHAVIIKGTELYDSKYGTFVDLGMLDVMQIFGRAGRPQYDKLGHGVIITSHEKLSHYLSLLTCQCPIESSFLQGLVDNLNAEVSLGTVSNIDEAMEWMSYTYLYVRMRRNPLVYGITHKDLMDDPTLTRQRREFVVAAAKALDAVKMVRYDPRTSYLHATDLGRTASSYYIKNDTVQLFNEALHPSVHEGDILAMISKAQEFDQLKVREDEMKELEYQREVSCELPVPGGCENSYGKVNILLQTHISRGKLETFSLISDQAYVVQNATRILRGVFDIVLRRDLPVLTGRVLLLCKIIERQQWAWEHPLRQFLGLTHHISHEIVSKLESRELDLDRIREMTSEEVGHLIHHVKMGQDVKRAAEEIPLLDAHTTIQPITRSVLRVRLVLSPAFHWNQRIHGGTSEGFWVWLEDPDTDHIYHHEYFVITKKQVTLSEGKECKICAKCSGIALLVYGFFQVMREESQTLVFTIPIFEPLPSQYYVRICSDRWLGSDSLVPISFQHLILPERHPPHTELLDLIPLPVSSLGDPRYELLYTFTHFNPIQTQLFHCLYHTDHNVLLGAPTGSGKTITAEIAMFRVFHQMPGSKVVYIAPMKALVRERVADWKVRLEEKLGHAVVELTGDVTPDVRAIQSADVIVTTPEKWDGVSRSWQTRSYVKNVALIVIDEIHLLGEDRGPVLEVIVSRTSFIASHTKRRLRIIGLSTALANAQDLASWLGISDMGLYNFRPSVRPVPLEVHISGFPGKHYCPRMATMNKPTYQAIRTHSPSKPCLVFVSSRRQTRLTALDLVAYLAAEDDSKQWLHAPEQEIEHIISMVKDTNLRLTLGFGIGLHHAGLNERDRRIVEELFVNQKIQVCIATATLAWGVNFPAHLVVVKGTEYYDGKKKRYVDFPITDVLQMMGRAGRPQYDDQGVAVILVQDTKKHFYKKFLYEPFPVESSLPQVLADHLNAEIVAGTIATKQDALDYLTWTFFFRRLLENPTYYGLDQLEGNEINTYLSRLVDDSFRELQESYCIEEGDDGRSVSSTSAGRIASFYYLSHKTLRMFYEHLALNSSMEDILRLLSDVHEFEELPVRHNEDILNGELSQLCRIPVDRLTLDSPHTKAHLLFQAHFSRLELPCSDYHTDLKSLLDEVLRILQAMLDVSGESGWLGTSLQVIHIMQAVIQARWIHDPPLLILPILERTHLSAFLRSKRMKSLPEVMEEVAVGGGYESLADILRPYLDEPEIETVFRAVNSLPRLHVSAMLLGREDEHVTREETWIPVEGGKEYTLVIHLHRLNPFLKGKEGKVNAPRFPKAQNEAWILILGDVERGELMALRRIPPIRGKTPSTYQLAFKTPSIKGESLRLLAGPS